jgi:hypothetical protein
LVNDVKNTISNLLNYFFNTTSGNDAYSLRYHYLCLIFKLINKNINDFLDINVKDLYNLGYNYEHYSKNEGNPASVRLSDWENKDLTPQELEYRLQVYLNKMFIVLSEVLKEYGFDNLGFK